MPTRRTYVGTAPTTGGRSPVGSAGASGTARQEWGDGGGEARWVEKERGRQTQVSWVAT